jgi:hypothetical protein
MVCLRMTIELLCKSINLQHVTFRVCEVAYSKAISLLNAAGDLDHLAPSPSYSLHTLPKNRHRSPVAHLSNFASFKNVHKWLIARLEFDRTDCAYTKFSIDYPSAVLPYFDGLGVTCTLSTDYLASLLLKKPYELPRFQNSI